MLESILAYELKVYASVKSNVQNKTLLKRSSLNRFHHVISMYLF